MFTEIQAWRIIPLGVKQIEVSKYMIQFLQLAQYLSQYQSTGWCYIATTLLEPVVILLLWVPL